MDRPYIFCHMMTSLDGKIMGDYMETDEGEKAGEVFYDLAFGKTPYYHHQGWLSGRITTDDNFTFYELPELNKNAKKVPEGDHLIGTDENMYYVSVDPSGKLGWKNNYVQYVDTKARVVEILTKKATNEYLDFLRRKEIPYIISGEEKIDFAAVMAKLKKIYGIETLMLGGGAVLNWSFIETGMCDEVSIVIAASADGSTKTPSIFSAGEYDKSGCQSFELSEVKKFENTIWLRYKVVNN